MRLSPWAGAEGSPPMTSVSDAGTLQGGGVSPWGAEAGALARAQECALVTDRPAAGRVGAHPVGGPGALQPADTWAAAAYLQRRRGCTPLVLQRSLR